MYATCLGIVACGSPDAVISALQEAVSPAGQPIPNVHSQKAFSEDALHVT